jgi:acid phosphatase
MDATAPLDAGPRIDAQSDGSSPDDATTDGAPSDATTGDDGADTGETAGDDTTTDGGIVETDGRTGDLPPHDSGGGELEAGDDASEADDASDAGSADAGPDAPDEGAPIADATAPDATPPCGGCSAGFTCGPSAYCRTSTGVPAFGSVFVVVLDNQPLSAIKGSSSAPYLNGLMNAYAYGTGYTTSVHPTLPNLVDLTSGNPQNIGCDCSPGTTNTCTALNCTDIAQSCSCPVAVTHVGDELDLAGIAWRAYAESMSAPCNPAGTTSADGGALFAAYHVPFLYYADVFGNNARCTDRVRDFGDFAGDLAAASYRVSMITPNLCDDMSGGCGGNAVKMGDTWLAAHVPAILAGPGFASGGHDVLFIVADEPDLATSVPQPFVVVSPLAKQGTTAGAYTHESLLTTIEDGLGLPRLGNTQGLAPIADVWR